MEEIDSLSAEPSFWDDPKKAQDFMSERGKAQDLVQKFEILSSYLGDASEFLEISEDDETLTFVQGCIEKAGEILASLELARMLNGEYDGYNAYVSINSGAGGTDSQDLCKVIFRMYQMYAKRRNWEIITLDFQPGQEAGFKNLELLIKGENVYGYLKAEAGVHRFIRVSPFGAKRRETSFVAVRVTPEIDDTIEIHIEDKDVRKDTYRSSGAGGQHVNKTDSAIRLTHIPTGIVVQCQTERSQPQNLMIAWKMLRARLYQRELEAREVAAGKRHASESDNAFGSQIRSYVMNPYKMIKDLRSGVQIGDVDRILNGDLDEMIEGVLLADPNVTVEDLA